MTKPAGLIVLVASAASTAPAATEGPTHGGAATFVCDRVLEDFSSSTPGAFPSGWQTRYDHNQEEARAKRVYVVEKMGRDAVLHATYGTHTITAVRVLPAWSLEEYPVLAWRWRAVRLPLGGDESDSDTNDSAASVYLAWDVGFPFRVANLRFAWSTTLPVGRVITKRLGHDRIIITESGSTADGGWRSVRVNVLAEARELLDSADPPSPAVLAVTTDADATGSSAEAYYADFRLCRRSGGSHPHEAPALQR